MIEIKVFQSKDCPGVIQFLHPTRLEDFATLSPIIKDHSDHSFFFYDEKTKTVTVRWFNHHGEIQLCGSGAYGVVKYLFTKYQVEKIILKTNQKEIVATKKDGIAHLHLPLVEFDQVNETSLGRVYSHPERGLYFFNVKEANLQQAHWQDYYQVIGGPKNIHALGVFSLDEERGLVRYFVPWHGREEDYVTGSLHQYLGFIVHKDYDLDQIHWKQVSSEPGELKVQILDGQAILSEIF